MKYRSHSFISIRNDRRTGNAGLGKTQGLGLTPTEFLALHGSPSVQRRKSADYFKKGYSGKPEIVSFI